MTNSKYVLYCVENSITVKCKNGYWISKGIFSAAYDCQADGTWSGDLSNVKPKIFHCFFWLTCDVCVTAVEMYTSFMWSSRESGYGCQ